MTIFVFTDEEQQALEEGEAARSLLDSPVFLQAIEAVRAQCAEAILTSDPAAKQAREDAYNLSRALSAVTVELETLQTRAETIQARVEALADEEHQPDATPGDY